MSWPDVTQEGYKKVINKDITGGDLWESQSGIDVASCKAVCNSNSNCKSFVFRKTDNVCFLNNLGESAPTTTANNHDVYYKQGEPATDDTKKTFFTENMTPVNGWQGNGLFGENGAHNCASSSQKSVRVGGILYGSNSTTDDDDAIQCSWVPIATNMCPDIGESATKDDLVYFRHSAASNDRVGNYDWGGRSGGGVYGDTSKFGNHGSRTSMNTNQGIICGYNRIKKDKWADLVSRYGFREDTKKQIIKQHCEGEGISSKELASDSAYCGNESFFSKSEYSQAILEKLKNEDNWWNDPVNCGNFRNVVVGNSNDQSVMRKAEEVINDLPNTGWSDDLVRALNSIKTSVPATKNVIDSKIESYCAESDGDNNEHCGCRNAVKYGKAKTCTNEIEGCEDVKRAQDLIDKVTRIDANFGRTIQSIYDPNFDSEACKLSITPTSTVLNVGAMQVRNYDIAACFNAIENSGTIAGDVSTKCNASVARYNADQSSSKSSSSDSTDSDKNDGTFISGETAGVKNDYWLIALCLCCICFLIIGVGLAAFLI